MLPWKNRLPKRSPLKPTICLRPCALYQTRIAKTTSLNHFALKSKLYFVALQSAFAALHEFSPFSWLRKVSYLFNPSAIPLEEDDMPDVSAFDSSAKPEVNSVSNVSGSVNLAGDQVTIGGDVVGRDKITTIGYTVGEVSTLLAQMSRTFEPKPFTGRCPYVSLDRFTADQADLFLGAKRSAPISLPASKKRASSSSPGHWAAANPPLVRAGLIPALKHGGLPNSDHWLYTTLSPGRNPIENLALAVSRLKSPDLGDYLRQHAADPDALHKCAESALGDLKEQRAVIFVDQFEEVFTQVSREAERLAFLNLLTRAATIEGGRVTVLFALRSDFIANCTAYPALNALVGRQFTQVAP